jgi:CheY-like chemotaxis protein
MGGATRSAWTPTSTRSRAPRRWMAHVRQTQPPTNMAVPAGRIFPRVGERGSAPGSQMRNPLPGESQPPESGPVVRGQPDPTPDANTAPGRHDSRSADAASILADELKTPLAVVIANLQLLTELVASVQVEAAGGLRPDAEAWLTTRMAEADNCLCDARVAAERIRETVAPKKPLRQRASDRPPALKDALRPARILIVDDEVGLGRALQRLFRDYDAVVNTSAQGALDRIVIGERFDLILSDVGMPGMSGCDLYDEIRRLDPEQASRMVFVTGGSDAQSEKGLAASGQPVLMKPFDPKELRSFVEKFLG